METHLPALILRLEDDMQRSVQRALDDVIPAWCVGIHRAFWDTAEGQIIAEALWFVNRDNALHIYEAVRLVYQGIPATPKQRMYQQKEIYSRLTPYPIPKFAIRSDGTEFKTIRNRYYVLRTEAAALYNQRANQHQHTIGTMKERMIAWFDEDKSRLHMRGHEIQAAYFNETGEWMRIERVREAQRVIRQR